MNCAVCMEPQNCDCLCNTCTDAKNYMKRGRMKLRVIIESDTLTFYNVVTINTWRDDTSVLEIWMRLPTGKMQYEVIPGVMYVESVL